MTTRDIATAAGSDLSNAGHLSEDLRTYLRAQGADLVGFGCVSHMDGAPAIMQPHRYLPDARSLISLGLHVNEASCDLIERSVREGELPASYHSYQLFTLAIVNPQLDMLAFQGAQFLERQGYRAYPFPANMPHYSKPSEEYPGGPGDISHRHVAVACGLGEIGWHNLLITPQFGTRQKLTTIITNASLVSDPVCEERLCNHCFQCARACPTSAIPVDPQEKTTVTIRGKASSTLKSSVGGAVGGVVGCSAGRVAIPTSRCRTKNRRPRNCFGTKPGWTRGKSGSRLHPVGFCRIVDDVCARAERHVARHDSGSMQTTTKERSS